MATTVIQRSFSAGEVAPELQSRVDQSRYSTALRTLRNANVLRYGGAQNRSGTIFLGEVNDSTKRVRLIPFVYNTSLSFVLEFGDGYIRFIKNRAYITDLTIAVTAVTNANPGVFTSVAHGLSTGDEVVSSAFVGMPNLNGRNFKIVKIGADTFSLKYMDGSTVVDTTAFGAYVSGGSMSRIYTLVSPYAYTDLAVLKYAESAKVITFAHPSYPPCELIRSTDSSWTMLPATFIPTFAGVGPVTASVGAAGSLTAVYAVTAISSQTGEESLPIPGANALTLNGFTRANPMVLSTTADHGLAPGELVTVASNKITGLFTVGQCPTTKTFELAGVDSSRQPAGGPAISGTATPNVAISASSAFPTLTNPNVISYPTSPGAAMYNIYKAVNGVFGLLGISKTLTFNDIGSSPNTADQPPQTFNPFLTSGDWPSCVGYIQQRLCFGGTVNSPNNFYASKIGQYKNFTQNFPIQDDDFIQFGIVGDQVQTIKHLRSLGLPIIFTDTGEHELQGNQSGVITPSAVNPKQNSYNGCNDVPPIVVDGNAVYCQAMGSMVRDLAWDFQVDGYRGNDLSIFSPHLLSSPLVEWSQQKIPHSIIWMVRADGVLIALTLIREQQITGWSRHDFGSDKVESVCCIPNLTNNEYDVYLSIKRTIGANTHRYIEVLNTRKIANPVDMIFMDASLSYDGRNIAATTMTLSGGTTWHYDETLTLTASVGFFSAANVGNEIILTGSDGSIIRFTIGDYTSTTVVTGNANKTVPAALHAVATAIWSKAVKTFSGLWHIEGKNVSVLGDGFVDASPNNAQVNLITVTNGSITLPKARAVVHVGLPFISDLETLSVDTAQGETISDKKKLTAKVSGQFINTRGVFIGPNPPTNDSVDPLENLMELKLRNHETMNDPCSLLNDTADLNISAMWNNNGRIFLRQVDPLPMTVIAITGEGLFPFKAGG